MGYRFTQDIRVFIDGERVQPEIGAVCPKKHEAWFLENLPHWLEKDKSAKPEIEQPEPVSSPDDKKARGYRGK